MLTVTTVERESAGMGLLTKANLVLTALDEHGELNVNQIAQIAGEPVSSMYRLLSSLMAIEWVERGTRRGQYRLGLYFLRIGGFVEDLLDVRAAARPALKELQGTTGVTSFLCLRRGPRAVCVERFEGRDVRQLAMQLGDSLPLYAGAAPLTLFAYLPQSERKALVEGFRREPREDGPAPSFPALEAAVEAIRARGYAVSDGDVTPGISAIGAPVFNHRGEIEAALSVSGLHDRVLRDEAATAALVLRAAAATSKELGYEETGVRV
jgi:DNA-binding IclR family transcriptional regulator